MTVVDQHGRVNPDPNFVSLDVLVEVQLDDGTSVSPAEPTYARGGPLDCSRAELEEAIRSLIFAHPRYPPGYPRAEPPQLVEEVASHGIEITLDAVLALPLTFSISHEVESERARQAGS